MMALLKRLAVEEDGQGFVEYAYIVALIAVGLMAMMMLYRNEIRRTFTEITAGYQSVT